MHFEIPLSVEQEGLFPSHPAFFPTTMRHPGKLAAPAAFLALCAFAAAMFFPALFEGKILAPLDITSRMLPPWNENANGAKAHNHNPSDAVTQYLPYRLFAEKSLKEDGYIGWNPYEMGGYSLAANTMALPGSWTTQLHRFLPFKDAWNLGILAEFLIAGSGMLVFLRERKLSWLPCLIGAAAYMANSQFTIWIYHRWALGSFCWLPWVLWSAGGGFDWKSLGIRQFLLPFFLALALLGGSLQHVAFVFIACGCVFAGGISNWKSIHSIRTPFVGWTLAFSLATAMTAFSLIPQASAYYTNISIGHVRGGIGYPFGISQVLYNIVLIPVQIWPWLVGVPQTIDGFKLLKSGFMDVAYLGSIPMILAIAGVFVKSMPRQAKWLVLAGLLIPLTPLYGPLYHRVQLLFLLGGAWMVAEMVAKLPALVSGRMIRGFSIAVLLMGAALFVGACLPDKIRNSIEDQVVAKAVVASDASQFGADKAWIEQRARRWTARFSLTNLSTAWIYGLLVFGTTGLVLSSQKNPAAIKWGNIMILGATSLELFTLFQTWTTFSDPRDLFPPHPAIEMVREAAGPHRVLQASPNQPFAEIFATPNLLASYGIHSVDAYESIHYRSTWVTLVNEPAETCLTLAGVGVSVQPTTLPLQDGTSSWPVVGSSGRYVIRKNPDVPATLSAGTGPIPDSPTGILAALKTSVPVTPALQTMNRWNFALPKDSTWIRIAQNWHEGWFWRVSGHNWTPCKKGADGACWIQPPSSGSGQIEVQFFPRPHWLSLISFGSALVWLVLLASIHFLKPRPAQPSV